MKIATYIDYGLAYLSVPINRINTQQKKELNSLVSPLKKLQVKKLWSY